MVDRSGGIRSAFPLAAGVLLNLAVGILYAWSVLVAPLEASLEAPRALVSGAQSLGLLFATVGTFVMHRLLAFIPLPRLALVMGALAGAGLALAGLGHSVAALLVGYGVVFGFGSGVVYFTAMTASSIDGPVPRSVAISINMAAVAVGGMIWAPVLSALAAELGPHVTLGIAGAVLLGAGVIGYLLLAAAKAEALAASGSVGLFQDILTERPRIAIAIFIGFFFVSFSALTMLGHAATMLGSWGAAGEATQFAPILASAGYIIGALMGGPLSDWLGGRRVLTGIAALIGAILLAMYLAPSIVLGLAALAVVGGGFGATASTHPVTIGGYYGAAAVARVYGRLAIAYGLGGLLGPFAAGALYDAEGSYTTVIILTAVFGLLGAVAYASLPRRGERRSDA